MRDKLSVAVLVASLALIAVAASTNSSKANRMQDQSATAESCDYSCLTGFIDQYMSALVAHDPSKLPVAANVKFTENTIPLKLGDALWGTISGMGTYKLYFADPRAGQAGLEATVRENGTPAILLVRLKVVDKKITEVETVVHRGADAAQDLEKFGHPNPVWTTPVTAGERTPRAEMLKDANLYFDGIIHSSGEMVPFDPKCNRILDGDQDTNMSGDKGWWDKGSFRPSAMGISENMSTGIWKYIHSINPRRYLIVDEKMGIVFGVFMFNHPGTVKYADVKGVGKVPMPAVTQRPSSVEMAEFFKVDGGKIRQIEGVSIALPYGAHTGW